MSHTDIWSQFLGEHLGWQFGAEKAQVENCLSRVVLIRFHPQIGQHVVGQSLCDVSTVQLEAEEHEADKGANLYIDLVHIFRLVHSCRDYTFSKFVVSVSLTLLTSLFSSFSVHSKWGS